MISCSSQAEKETLKRPIKVTRQSLSAAVEHGRHVLEQEHPSVSLCYSQLWLPVPQTQISEKPAGVVVGVFNRAGLANEKARFTLKISKRLRKLRAESEMGGGEQEDILNTELREMREPRHRLEIC